MGPGVRVYGLVDARLCRAVALRSSAACARHLSSMPLHSASSTSIPITHSGVGEFGEIPGGVGGASASTTAASAGGGSSGSASGGVSGRAGTLMDAGLARTAAAATRASHAAEITPRSTMETA